MTIKEGDFISEDELKNQGWEHSMSLAAGYYAYEKDNEVIFYHRGDSTVFKVMNKPKFTYP